MAASETILHSCSRFIFVVIAFFSAFIVGAIKGLIVGPIASSILIVGNVSVILGLFPFHAFWSIYTLAKTCMFDPPLKLALFIALSPLTALWLGLSIAGSVLVGIGYGFFTPWVSTFEAFRKDGCKDVFYHFIVDGTLETIKGSCTVVVDFLDLCYHSYPNYLKEHRDSCVTSGDQPLRFVNVPGFIAAGLIGVIVDVPLFTAIAVVKSPYMLFRGWYRMAHDLFSREGPFLETACIPIAGLTILFWPIVVIGSVIIAVVSSIFVGLYAAVVVYQEKSFRKGVAFAVAMVAEFDEYTNDGLYLKEGTFLPKPKFRKNRQQTEARASVEASTMIPTLAPSRSVRQAIRQVNMVQVWGAIMRQCELHGKELLDLNVITLADLKEYLKGKNESESGIVAIGLRTYALLRTLLHSIKMGSDGLVVFDGFEITHLNRPNDKLMEWFFQPLLVLKDQMRGIDMKEEEERFLEKVVLYGNDTQKMSSMSTEVLPPQDPLRAAQIQGISRRLIGLIRSLSKFPTYRRKYRQVVKTLLIYQMDKGGVSRTDSARSNVVKDGSRSDSARSNVVKDGSMSDSGRSNVVKDGLMRFVSGFDKSSSVRSINSELSVASVDHVV